MDGVVLFLLFGLVGLLGVLMIKFHKSIEGECGELANAMFPFMSKNIYKGSAFVVGCGWCLISALGILGLLVRAFIKRKA